MRKKKVAVLHAQVPFVRGGAEMHVENLVKNLKSHGFDAELVSIPFKWYPANALFDSYFMWQMTDLSESNGEKIDLVIPLKVPTYAVRHPNKVIWLMHQYRAAYDLKNNANAAGLNTVPNGKQVIEKITQIDNQALADSAAIYANSKNVAARLKKYNQIDSVPLYHPPALADRYFTQEYGDYILSVGRLDRSKRTDLLIRALPYCDSRIKVIIAGKGPELENLERLAERLGVSDRVSLPGFVPDDGVLKLYANALAVCFPPIDEDYGYITLEAFLSKKPILTCKDSGGVLEFAEDGENAFIVDYSAEAMGACFDKLYHNKTLAEELGRSGYRRVKDISWDVVVDELTKTIR